MQRASRKRRRSEGKLYDDVVMVIELTYLDHRIISGGGCEAAVTLTTRLECEAAVTLTTRLECEAAVTLTTRLECEAAVTLTTRLEWAKLREFQKLLCGKNFTWKSKCTQKL